jgi:hypothetical protein
MAVILVIGLARISAVPASIPGRLSRSGRFSTRATPCRRDGAEKDREPLALRWRERRRGLYCAADEASDVLSREVTTSIEKLGVVRFARATEGCDSSAFMCDRQSKHPSGMQKICVPLRRMEGRRMRSAATARLFSCYGY